MVFPFILCYLFCPLSLHFRLSIYFLWNLISSMVVSVFFLVGLSLQPGGIPASAVIDYGLSSFIGALLSCKITQGCFFSLYELICRWHFIREWPSLGLFFRHKQSLLRNPAILLFFFLHLCKSLCYAKRVLFQFGCLIVILTLVQRFLTNTASSQLQRNAMPKPEKAN